ncbi:COMPASS (complex proteins associated with Set1p) component [Lignoscripta atroalba]|nr:COMPASS (complex proteins associated with Set1p) component [Lignoscripta atroalba]
MPEPQDTAMTEAPSSAAPIHSTATTTLQPQQPRTATPTRHINGTGPGTTVDAAPPMPSKAAAHGAPVRRYLNEKVTGVLLEGMKKLAAEQPEDPLKVLGEYLLSRSKELEGSQPGL